MNVIPLVSLILAMSLAAAAAEYENSVLASVEGYPITLYDVVSETLKKEIQKSKAMSGTELREEILKNRKDTIEDLIARKLIFLEFKAKEYKIPDQHIEDMIDEICMNMAGGDRKLLEKKLAEAGMTMDQFREKAVERAAVEIYTHEFCYRKINITPHEVSEYYDKHQDEFSEAPKAELQILFLNSSGPSKDKLPSLVDEIGNDVKKADENIFTTLVSLYSDGPGKDKGGRTGWIEKKNLRPDFTKALGDKVEPGATAGPIKTEEGYYFIRVAGVKGQNFRDFEEVKDSIKEKLLEEQRKAKYKELVDRLKQKALVRYFY